MPRRKKTASTALAPVAPISAPSPAQRGEGTPGDMAQADLESLTEILTRYLPSVSVEQAKMAVKRILTDHRQQLGVFMVAVAKAKMSRLVRLLNSLDTIETTLLSPERLRAATNNELARIWAVAQGAAQEDMDLIERVATGAKGNAPTSSTTVVNVVGTAVDASLLEGYGLDAPARERVRVILTSFLQQMGRKGIGDE